MAKRPLRHCDKAEDGLEVTPKGLSRLMDSVSPRTDSRGELRFDRHDLRTIGANTLSLNILSSVDVPRRPSGMEKLRPNGFLRKKCAYAYRYILSDMQKSAVYAS